ncbi:MAG: DUF642 domain-containing protein [Patescibacteria group bacterium]
MKQTKTIVAALLSFLFLAFTASAANAENLIGDPSFELNNTPTLQTVYAADTFLSPWHVLNNVDLADEDNIWTKGPAFDGKQYIDLDGNKPGAIYQGVATTPGMTYTVTVAYANNYFNQPSASAQVSIYDDNHNIYDEILFHNSSVNGNLDWTQFTTQFTAQETTTYLKFTSLSGTNSAGGILIDNVSVHAPEPSGVVFMLIPAAGAILRRRRPRICH